MTTGDDLALRARLQRVHLDLMQSLTARGPLAHLHWGLWADVEERPDNLALAQDAYADFVVARVPASAASLLDVGCGLGSIAARLARRRIAVTALTPVAEHAALIRAAGVDGLETVCTRFEEYRTDQRFDVVLLAESVNYFLAMDPGGVRQSSAALLAKCEALLAPGGTIVLADTLNPDFLQTLDADPRLTTVARVDISADVKYTADALQAAIDRWWSPFRRALLDAILIVDPELHARLVAALAALPHPGMRSLFADVALERQRLSERPYLVVSLRRR
ncbi:MAG TPA: methyltransferase domain-containing protein [Polyangia bacterium]|jgi:SAM-dependent methyltransferase